MSKLLDELFADRALRQAVLTREERDLCELIVSGVYRIKSADRLVLAGIEAKLPAPAPVQPAAGAVVFTKAERKQISRAGAKHVDKVRARIMAARAARSA